MRKHYLDNIRSLVILWLIPYHTIMFYTPSLESPLNFPNTPDSFLPTIFQVLTTPWIMPLLFLNAGMTTFYSLQRRSYKQYLIERVKKLLLPALAGWFLLVPGMRYIPMLANGTAEGFFAFYQRFIMSPTLHSSFHLWFLFVLFVVSLVALPLIMFTRKRGWRLPAGKLTLPVLLALAIPLLFLLMGIAKINTTYAVLFAPDEPVYPWLGLLVSWAGILAAMGLASKYLEFHNKVTAYMARASFAFYIFHYICIVLVAWWITAVTGNALLQFIVIMLGATALSFGFYALIRRIPGLRFLFGISAPKKKG